MIESFYYYEAEKNRARIILRDDRSGEAVDEITVEQAAQLITSLAESVSAAFMDFTATTPNRGSPAQTRQNDG